MGSWQAVIPCQDESYEKRAERVGHRQTVSCNFLLHKDLEPKSLPEKNFRFLSVLISFDVYYLVLTCDGHQLDTEHTASSISPGVFFGKF